MTDSSIVRKGRTGNLNRKMHMREYLPAVILVILTATVCIILLYSDVLFSG